MKRHFLHKNQANVPLFASVNLHKADGPDLKVKGVQKRSLQKAEEKKPLRARSKLTESPNNSDITTPKGGTAFSGAEKRLTEVLATPSSRSRDIRFRGRGGPVRKKKMWDFPVKEMELGRDPRI